MRELKSLSHGEMEGDLRPSLLPPHPNNLLHSGVLVLLVLRHQVVHIDLGLSKLHLIHVLAYVPVQEGLALEHGQEMLGDKLEQLLNGHANEGDYHL